MRRASEPGGLNFTLTLPVRVCCIRPVLRDSALRTSIWWWPCHPGRTERLDISALAEQRQAVLPQDLEHYGSWRDSSVPFPSVQEPPELVRRLRLIDSFGPRRGHAWSEQIKLAKQRLQRADCRSSSDLCKRRHSPFTTSRKT